MRLINHWHHPGSGAHAAVYLGEGRVALPAKYGDRVTVWDVGNVAAPRLLADMPGRPDCQSVALCNGYLIVGSDRGIESMRVARDEVTPIDCHPFAPEINDFEVAADTLLAVSKTNAIKAVHVGDDGKLTGIGVRRNVLARCHGASHEGRLVAVVGFKADGNIDRPLGLFPDAIDRHGRFSDPAGWRMANDGAPARPFMNISNRIVLFHGRAYIATGRRTVSNGRQSWVLDPTVSVLDVRDPSAPGLLGSYPCDGSTTCTGLYLDRDRACLIVGSGHIVRRFDIDANCLHEVGRLSVPYSEASTEAGANRPPTVHDVCGTDLKHNGLPVFAAGGQQTDDLYLFTA